MDLVEPARMGQVSQPLQFTLWEGPPREKSNMVALYDIAPRFNFDLEESGDGRRKIIKREFTLVGEH